MNKILNRSNGFVMPPIRLVMVALAIAGVAVAAIFIWRAVKPSAFNVHAPDYWPTNGWRTAAPEAHGFNSALVVDGLRAIRKDGTKIHSPLVVSGGDVILDA